MGGNPDLVGDVALWAVPAGIIGGRIYFDITTPADIPHHWWGIFAVWSGGLGIWGGIAGRGGRRDLAGQARWRQRRACSRTRSPRRCWWPRPSAGSATTSTRSCSASRATLPWALEISQAHRPAGYLAVRHLPAVVPVRDDLRSGAGRRSWSGSAITAASGRGGCSRCMSPGYSAYRIFEETIRIDSSEHFLGLRLNFYVATILMLIGIAWFIRAQRAPAVTAEPASQTTTGSTERAARQRSTSGQHGRDGRPRAVPPTGRRRQGMNAIARSRSSSRPARGGCSPRRWTGRAGRAAARARSWRWPRWPTTCPGTQPIVALAGLAATEPARW